jgi:hypothetical protein
MDRFASLRSGSSELPRVPRAMCRALLMLPGKMRRQVADIHLRTPCICQANWISGKPQFFFWGYVCIGLYALVCSSMVYSFLFECFVTCFFFNK